MAKRVSNKQNFDFKAQLNQFKAYTQTLPRVIGNEAVNFYKKSFTRQGFIDEGMVEKWEPRKVRPGATPRSRSRAILVSSGRLKRSPRITKIGRMFVSLGSNVPYAQIHNEGGKIDATVNVRRHDRNSRHGKQVVRSHSRRMKLTIPQRKFMGESRFFNRRALMQIGYKLKGIFNSR